MNDAIQQIANLVLVPIIEISDASAAVPLADALMAGGLPCAEITFRTPAAAASIEAITRARPNILVGAGTVLSTQQVDVALKAGAQFVVSPGFDRRVVEYCVRRQVRVLPGVITPTEIQMAIACGIDLVKFFPAEAAGGADYLKAIAAPFRALRFIPTGGIDASNLARYLALPQVVAIGGSWMAPRDLIQHRDFAGITKRVVDSLELMRTMRPSPIGSATASNQEADSHGHS